LATPATRHLARKHQINLANVPATGKDGRISKEDILNYVNGSAQPSIAIPVQPQIQKGIPHAEPTSIADKVITLSGYARVMAKTMTASLSIPHFGYCDEVVMDNLIKLREEMKAHAKEKGIKLTYMPIMIKAASLALKKYSILNSAYDPEKNTLTYKASHNIGVAMDSPNGLIVPNIKNVQEKSIFEVAEELNRLQKAALNSAVQVSDLTGGTFSLSNIGAIGGTYASPVLVVPEVAIGAIGKIQKLPRFDDAGNVIPVHIVQVSWSADHRVIDGATIAKFSNLWKRYLEFPNTLIFDCK